MRMQSGEHAALVLPIKLLEGGHVPVLGPADQGSFSSRRASSKVVFDDASRGAGLLSPDRRFHSNLRCRPDGGRFKDPAGGNPGPPPGPMI